MKFLIAAIVLFIGLSADLAIYASSAHASTPSHRAITVENQPMHGRHMDPYVGSHGIRHPARGSGSAT